MPTPATRTPIRIARGTYSNLNSSIADIQEGEIVYAIDQQIFYVKTGGVLVSTTIDLSAYLTTATATSTYLTQANAASTYQTQAGMSSYLTTSAAGTTYAPKASPTFTGTVNIPAGASISGYLTTATASSTYLTITDAASTYQTQSGMSSYLTTSAASSTYAPTVSPTFTVQPYFNGSCRGNVTAIAALNIDCSAGNFFTKTINGASTFTVSNVPASRAYAFTLEVTHTSGVITWFSGVEWPGGTAPSLTTGKTHLFVFVTDDGGSRWRASSLTNYTN